MVGYKHIHQCINFTFLSRSSMGFESNLLILNSKESKSTQLEKPSFSISPTFTDQSLSMIQTEKRPNSISLPSFLLNSHSNIWTRNWNPSVHTIQLNLHFDSPPSLPYSVLNLFYCTSRSAPQEINEYFAWVRGQTEGKRMKQDRDGWISDGDWEDGKKGKDYKIFKADLFHFILTFSQPDLLISSIIQGHESLESH